MKEKCEYPYNLLCDIFGLSYEEIIEKTKDTQDLHRSIEYVLGSLTSKQYKALMYRYKCGYTLQACANEFGVSATYIRQVIAKSLRILRSPSNTKFLLMGVQNLVAKKDKEIYILTKKLDNKSSNNCILIDDLNLSIKTHNVLKRQGIDTVDDIFKIPYTKLINLPNFGDKALNELRSALNVYGYDILGENQVNISDDEWKNLDVYSAGFPLPHELSFANYKTPADFIGKTYYDILAISGIGKGKADKIYNLLKDHGIELSKELPQTYDIRYLNLPEYSLRWLYRNDIRTIDELTGIKESDLINHGLTHDKVNTIKKRLSEHGFELRSENK